MNNPDLNSTFTISEQRKLRPAVLAGLCIGNDPRFERSMRELAACAEAVFCEVRAVFIQNLPKENTGLYFGAGKVAEIRAYLDEINKAADPVDLVIVDASLSPKQLKNLGDMLGAEIWDRTALILKIFAERARTREANLQVEYARLEYLLPRLRGMHDDLGRQAGASGAMSNKGLGEKKIELDRRRIEHRMAELRRELEEVSRERRTQRSRRQKSGLPLVALVGYTNAGKSTILNGMIRHYGGSEEKLVFEKDMLFATLDTSVRRIEPGEGRTPFLLADTVGFMENLPASLVKAFRSTLEEAACADLLLIIADLTDPEYRNSVSVTIRTLEEIGAGDIPRIFVFNKADAADIASPVISHREIRPEDGRITISAKDPEGLERLTDFIYDRLREGNITCDLLIPYSEGAALHDLMERADAEIISYTDTGTLVHCSIKRGLYRRYAGYRVTDSEALIQSNRQ